MGDLGVLVGAAGALHFDHGVPHGLLAAEEAQARPADRHGARVPLAEREAVDGVGDAPQLARRAVGLGVRAEAPVGRVDDDHLQVAVVPDDLDRDPFVERH